MSQTFKVVPEESDGVTKLVGYDAIQKALDVSRSTIERAVKSGELPAPSKIKSRTLWRASDINRWAAALFDGRLTKLAAAAATDVNDLTPDELDEKALGLIVDSLGQRTGTAIDPSDLTLHVTRRLDADQFSGAEKDEFTLYAERFSNFDKRRACAMAAWLFQAIRADIGRSAPGREKLIYNDADTLERFGRAALHDEDWEALIAAFDASEAADGGG